MILRAASESDSDESLVDARETLSRRDDSVFGSPYAPPTCTNDRTTRYSWFVACGALILLLLVDMAALFDASSLDVFALLPLLKTLVRSQESILLSPLASMLNQVVGLTLVAVWIYSREKSLASTQGIHCARYGLWTVGALLFLGHVVSCLYLLFALMESNGDRSKFWLGRKHPKKHCRAPSGQA